MEEEPGLVDVAFEQIEFLRHAPTKAKSFEEIMEMCRSVKNECNRSPVLMLLEAYNYQRVGCFENALESALEFMDYFSTKDFGRFNDLERRRTERRCSTLKHGLVLLAKLHRIFGSYLVGSMLLTQAMANANDNHNILALRLCMLEESAYDLNALNNNTLNAFSRHNTNDKYVETLQKTFMARYNNWNHQTEIATLEETFNNLLSAGYGSKNARFKAVVQHFRIGIAFMRTVNAAIRCESSDIIAKYSAVALENETSTQYLSHSRYVRDGIQAIDSTVKLSNGCTAIMLPDENSENEPDYATECTLISSVNVAYSHAYRGKFKDALELIEQLKEQYPTDSCSMLSTHWRLAEACILFDQNFFNGKFQSAIQTLEHLECFSPVEALFRRSLVDFVYDRFDETNLANFIKTLRKNVDPHLKIRCRLALGTLRCAIGKCEQAVEDLERCVKSAQKRSLDYLEKVALRRLAYAYICVNNLNKAEECLQSARSILTDVNGYILETFLFHVTQFELIKQKISNMALKPNDPKLETLKNEGLNEINCAIENSPSNSYPILEQRLYKEATLFANNTLNDKSMANAFAERYLSIKCEHNVNFCWFVL